MSCENYRLHALSWLMWSLFQVVYCHQGHEIYCKAILENNVYSLGDECKPWEKYNLQVSTATIIFLVHTHLLQSSSINQPQEICVVKKVKFVVELSITLCSITLRGRISTSKGYSSQYCTQLCNAVGSLIPRPHPLLKLRERVWCHSSIFLGRKQYHCMKTGGSNLIGHCSINT